MMGGSARLWQLCQRKPAPRESATCRSRSQGAPCGLGRHRQSRRTGTPGHRQLGRVPGSLGRACRCGNGTGYWGPICAPECVPQALVFVFSIEPFKEALISGWMLLQGGWEGGCHQAPSPSSLVAFAPGYTCI